MGDEIEVYIVFTGQKKLHIFHFFQRKKFRNVKTILHLLAAKKQQKDGLAPGL